MNDALWGRYYLAVEEGDFARARALEPVMAERGAADRGAAIYLSAQGVRALAEGDLLRARDRFGRSPTHWHASRDRGGIAFILAHFAALAARGGRGGPPASSGCGTAGRAVRSWRNASSASSSRRVAVAPSTGLRRRRADR
jgi:hypothetical protein